MDCARKTLSFAIVYSVYFVLPWLCGLRLLWELHQDTIYWTQNKYYSNIGELGTILLTIFLFSNSLQIISYSSKYFIFPVILEIIAFGAYIFLLGITYDISLALVVVICSGVKALDILWSRYQAQMDKANSDSDRYTHCV